MHALTTPCRCVALGFLGVLFGVDVQLGRGADAGEAKWIDLTAPADFAPWQDDRRGWVAAGDAELDADNDKRLSPKPGQGVVLAQGDASNLETRQKFQDVDVKLEFMVPRQSNSGVKLNGLYEIQIRDTHAAEKPTGDDCGGIYPRAELSPRYRLLDAGFPPLENAAKEPGVWQSLEFTFVSPRFDGAGSKKKTSNARFERVVLNGRVIHKKVDLKWPTGHAWNTKPEVAEGPLHLQGDHGPVAFRKIRVRELSAEK